MVLGFLASSPGDLVQHASLGIFFTLMTLLAYSMTMFYLIGKGKAVREAAEEANLSRDFYIAIARARKPVFSIDTLAMLLTMATAIFGGGVDAGSVPTWVHLLLALSAIAVNVMALRTGIRAMLFSSRIVAEVDALLVQGQSHSSG